MYLSQEYLKRHGLDVAHAVYDETVNLIFRSGNYQWVVFNGTWRAPALHPGYYVFQMFRPIHNGYVKPSYGVPAKAFEATTDQSIVHWDEYERFIFECLNKFQVLRKHGFEPVLSQREAELTCWEMFLYIFDRWLAENMDSKFFDLVIGSTLPGIPLNERRDNYLYATDMLEDYTSTYRALHEVILIYAERHNYSEWLAKLANTNLST
jgi:hypothetical protein